MRQQLRAILRRILPVTIYKQMIKQTRYPPVGKINFGDLRNIRPVSMVWGLDRGQPIDRYYIEQFVTANAADIRGHVLEIGDDLYTTRFGAQQVGQRDILHVSPDHEKATIIADLTHAPQIPANTFDCIICTQTLQFIYAVRPAIATLYRIMKPGGVLLVTIPGISQISRYDMDHWGDFWRFTTASIKRLFVEEAPGAEISAQAYGNVLSATVFLHGIAADELSPQELDQFDPDYEVLIAVRLVKKEEIR